MTGRGPNGVSIFRWNALEDNPLDYLGWRASRSPIQDRQDA